MDIDELENIFFNADNMQYINSISDVKRINALKDFLKFDTIERVQHGGSVDIDKYLIFKTINKRYLHKFRYEGHYFEIGFKDLPTNITILNEITYACFDKILQLSFSSSKPNDQVRIVIEHPSIPDQPISLPYMRRDELNAQLILTAIALVAQSNKELKLDEFMRITTSRVEMPVGGKNISDYIADLRSVIQISNHDNQCLLRAVVVAIAYVNYKSASNPEKSKELNFKYKQLRRLGNNHIQTNEANKLRDQLGISNGPYGFETVKLVEQHLNVQITIVGDVTKQFIAVTIMI